MVIAIKIDRSKSVIPAKAGIHLLFLIGDTRAKSDHNR